MITGSSGRGVAATMKRAGIAHFLSLGAAASKRFLRSLPMYFPAKKVMM